VATRSHPGATLARAARRRRSSGVPSWRRSLSGSDEPTPGCRVALFRFPAASAMPDRARRYQRPLSEPVRGETFVQLLE